MIYIIIVILFVATIGYAFIFETIDRQLTDLCERINDLEEEFYNNNKDMEEGDN